MNWKIFVSVAATMLTTAVCFSPTDSKSQDIAVASGSETDQQRSIPKRRGSYLVGRPYTRAGRTFVPAIDPDYDAQGFASWYGRHHHGRFTANGEVFDSHAISAAHPTLPLPSYVRVTNLSNGRSVVVRVNDRGPFRAGRIIDLSHRAAELLGFRSAGLARVRVQYLEPALLEGSNDKQLLATLRHDGVPAPAPSAILLASELSSAADFVR
jgi:rare lipoprotein A